MSEQVEQWQVAVIPNKAGQSTIESFAHWHCGIEGVKQETVVLQSALTAAQSRVVELERSRDAWEKHCNELANKKDADIQRLELEREQIEKRELALRTQLVALYCRRQPDPGISEWYTIRITKDHAERIMEATIRYD